MCVAIPSEHGCGYVHGCKYSQVCDHNNVRSTIIARHKVLGVIMLNYETLPKRHILTQQPFTRHMQLQLCLLFVIHALLFCKATNIESNTATTEAYG